MCAAQCGVWVEALLGHGATGPPVVYDREVKHRAIRTVGAMLLAAGAATGCTALLGSFDVAPATGPELLDGQANPDGPAEGGPLDGGTDTTVPVACTSPEVACDNVCVRLTMSGDHCGKCGHSCGGGTCTGGVNAIAAASGKCLFKSI